MSGADILHRKHVDGLFRAHYLWLCTRLRQSLNDAAAVEDIACETFVQLLAGPWPDGNP